jgi:hypothetical protein
MCASWKVSRAHVLLPTPRAPYTKKLPFGWRQNPRIQADCHDVVISPCIMTALLA